MLANPFWYALTTEHAGIAIGSAQARCYPADVIPFCGVESAGPQAMRALRELLTTGQTIHLAGGDVPAVRGIEPVGRLVGWQMHWTAPADSNVLPDRDDVDIRMLGGCDGPAMMALTDLAFPGFFRARTYELGQYYGISVDGELVAMAGERLALPNYREISAVCTHPAHTGKGYGALLVRQLLRAHSAAGLKSFLHVAAVNERAIALYERLGFVKTAPTQFHHLRAT
jgi:ribosomal protein S18 acetylase RimI-like enzyme